MNLATATVTVFFVGLMNFYTPPPPSTVKREVIVPLATATDAEHASVKLKPHKAFIVIRGLSAESDCTRLEGRWNGDDLCTIGPILSGKRITLPTPAAPTYTVSNRNLPPPAITGQCPGVTLDPTYRTSASKYAVRLDITHGYLGACTSEMALIPRLTLKDSSGRLTIGAETVTLEHGAAVYIMNSPEPPPAGESVDERQHFYWYYKMFLPPTGKVCTGWPKVSHMGNACDPKIPHVHNLNTQSGTSCTPTGWP